MPKGNNDGFFNLVFEVVKLIPKGRVTSYGAIANYLGSAKSSRMVGWAMNSTHNLPDKIPAHRVVNRNGLLTGKVHFSHIDMMQKLLEAEGLKAFFGILQMSYQFKYVSIKLHFPHGVYEETYLRDRFSK